MAAEAAEAEAAAADRCRRTARRSRMRGADVTADPGERVTLDGSGSRDPDGETLTYAWTQESGPTVALSGATSATASFTAPADPGDLAFRLTVTDPGRGQRAKTT